MSSNQPLPLNEKIALLQSTNIFSETPESILSELAPLMQEMTLEEGTDVFKEDDPGDSMYIISSGQVHIHRRKTTLAVLRQNQVFGELSLLDAEPRSATATAKTYAILFKIEQEPFYRLVDTRPEIARGFIKMLCGRLRTLNEKTIYSSL